jgi:hypothetical protein
MPLPDEIGPAAVVDHRPQWPLEFEESAGQLRAVKGGVPLQIDHVGSTSVPGLTAKDCVDVEIRVRSIDKSRDITLLSAFGFRCRPEPWNRTEVSGAIPCRKPVFAYGRIKAPAAEVLMAAAERWATETAWSVTPGPHRRPRDFGWRLLRQLPATCVDIAPTRTPRPHSMISIMGNPCASP